MVAANHRLAGANHRLAGANHPEMRFRYLKMRMLGTFGAEFASVFQRWKTQVNRKTINMRAPDWHLQSESFSYE